MNPVTATPTHPLVSVVVIGRNEGERLTRCLASVAAMRHERFGIETIYVDSASTDDSVQRARAAGARVLEVNPERPSAALGRNAGWRAAKGGFILFLDGDTELHPDFVALALEAMQDPNVAIAWGHRRESRPDASIYNRVLDLDWIYPPGPSEFCGGDALVRRDVLEAVGGFDAGLIAGEEPEMCRRIRACGHDILHLDLPMTRHDLAIHRFAGYWRRAYRAGHAYAEISTRFKDSDDPLWLADARRNLIHALVVTSLLVLLASALAWPWTGLAATATLLVLVGRTYRRCRWKSTDASVRLLYGIHAHFQQIPIAAGQIAFFLGRRQGTRHELIEYKHGSPKTTLAG